MNRNKFGIKAFTLAEVLVTITIIGIVASLILPRFTAYKQKMEFNTALKNVYSDLNQVTQKIMMDNGGTMVGAFTSVDGMRDGYVKYFKNVVKTCPYNNAAYARSNGCFMPGVPKNIDGTSINHANYGAGASWFVLGNGAAIAVQGFYDSTTQNCLGNWPAGYGPNYRYCSSLTIDVNGPKPPNVVGKDYFPDFLITKDGLVIMDNAKGLVAKCNQVADEYNCKFGCATNVFKGINYYN